MTDAPNPVQALDALASIAVSLRTLDRHYTALPQAARDMIDNCNLAYVDGLAVDAMRRDIIKLMGGRT